jgi:iron complex transport system substrate-binding protein
MVLACGVIGGERSTASRIFIDDLGRTVEIPLKVDRVVSLAPSITESIFAVGAGDRLIGVTSYCDHPVEALAVAKVGDTINPSMETIAAMKPQIVFVSTASQIEGFTRAMEGRGIPVFVSAPGTLDAVLDDLRRMGEIFGTQDRAVELLTGLQERISDAESRADRSGKRVFVQISSEPLFTAGKGSFITDLIERAGGRSVTADVPTAYPKLSKETAAALDPQYLILSGESATPNPVLVRGNSEKKILRIEPDYISRPGPRLVNAFEQIVDFLRDATGNSPLGERK